MPLAFATLSHGTVAFGFYNIETDGLLLDRYFFFCSDFCRAACSLAAAPESAAAATTLPGHRFPDPEEVGDLMGAIHGVRHTGFLGALYRRWPFPEDPRDFRQKLSGEENRTPVLALLDRMAEALAIEMRREPRFAHVEIGPYRFDKVGFAALLGYVVRGGYPTWEGYEDGRMPDAVRPLLEVLAHLQA